MSIIDKRVPRVPDKKPENIRPTKNRQKATTLFFVLEFHQSARQKIDNPNMVYEKGIGFPENNSTLPEICL